MRTCDSCGFENAEPGKPCPLCGASEIAHAPAEADAKGLKGRLTRWLSRDE